MHPPEHCTLCPRRCGANRRATAGLCGGGALPRVAHAGPHFWEEPCLSGTQGSGTVFFSGCPLGCVFCQNQAIRAGGVGRAMAPGALADVFVGLQNQGVHNLNLVTPTHYRPWLIEAVSLARGRGLALPVVWNTGGYEPPGAVEELAGAVDVWLADLKFYSPALAETLAGAPDYFALASAFLREAAQKTGPPVFGRAGLLQRGLVVRILVLPGHGADAVRLLEWLAAAFAPEDFLLSLLCQYTPPAHAGLAAPLNRRLSTFEYRRVTDAALRLGFDKALTQQRASAAEGYVPRFNML